MTVLEMNFVLSAFQWIQEKKDEEMDKSKRKGRRSAGRPSRSI